MYAETHPSADHFPEAYGEVKTPIAADTGSGMVAPMPISGYTAQWPARLSVVNINKQLEEVVLQRLDDLAQNGEADPRWLAIGRTGIEQAFMAINRAVMQPQRVKLGCLAAKEAARPKHIA